MTDAVSTTLTTSERWKLIVLLSASFTLAVDFSVLNIALPQIGRDVGLDTTALQWVITAFALPAAGFGLLFGRLGDLIGRRRLFMIGISLLGIGSIIGGVAPTAAVLLTGRVVQGFGAAAVAPTALSLLTTSFEEGPRRTRALGINGALIAAGFTVGALLGGILTTGISWRAAFWINLPITLVVLIVTPTLFPANRPDTKPRLDWPGAILISIALTALVFGLTVAGDHGLGTWQPYPWLAAAVILGALFAWRELHAAHPLVTLSILRRRTIAVGNLTGLTTFSMMSSATYLLTLYLQDVLSLNALLSGIVIAVVGVVSITVANFIPKLIGIFGLRTLVIAALTLQGIGMIVIAFAGASAWAVAIIIAGRIIAGLGHIGSIIGYTAMSSSGLPDNEQGLATGLATTSQQVGIALGTPLMASILALTLTVTSTDSASTAALRTGLATTIAVNGLILIAVALLVVLLLLRSGSPDRLANHDPAAQPAR
ncbi:MFS transporter [Micropruina sp.]|uniref:MFS transporter n=1 Tax=Micropruina sp. TaxID=2737536 RepID=UPI0039E3F51C